MKLILEIARFLEALVLRGFPAIAAMATGDTYRRMGVGPGGENENAGAFTVLCLIWIATGPKFFVRVKGILRWRAWLSALVFIVVMQAAAVMFMVIWHPPWAGFWIFLVTVIVMAITHPEEEATAATKVIQSAPVPRPVRSPGRRRLLLAVIIVGFLLCVGGYATYYFQGPAGSVAWQRIRAGFGSASAEDMLELGWQYREGRDVRQDYNEAAVWFERAATKGSNRARYDLGVLCYYGLGVKEDPVRARSLLERAVKEHYTPAFALLGLIVRDDPNDAGREMVLWQAGAEAGDGWAEYLLGSAFLDRRRQSEDNLVDALFWLEKARRDGVEPIPGILQHAWATVPQAQVEPVAAAVFRRLDKKSPASGDGTE